MKRAHLASSIRAASHLAPSLLAASALAACAPRPAPIVAAPVEAAPAPPPAPPLDASGARPAFKLHAADVGTGLALFLEGEDFSLVYDAGSNDDLATGDKNRFVAYLRAVRPTLGAIDHVILSHPHRDHVELLPDVLATYRVGDVWDAGSINDICGYRRFLQAVADAPATTYHAAARGAGAQTIDFGKAVCKLPAKLELRHGPQLVEGKAIPLGEKASMTFLHASPRAVEDDFNESSLVVMFDLDGAKVLVMGDAEAGGRADPQKPPSPKSVEGHVLGRYGKGLHADVLVAGHHGSKSSSRKAFVDAVAPKISIVSSGPKEYGKVVLPDPEIRAELKAVSELFETDLDDAACAQNPAKIGPDADGRPGGCDNVQVEIRAGAVEGRYARRSD